MNGSVVGSLLMFLMLFGSAAVHAVSFQAVFADAADDGSSEEPAAELYRVAAAKSGRHPRCLCAEISFVDIAVRSLRQPTRSTLHAAIS